MLQDGPQFFDGFPGQAQAAPGHVSVRSNENGPRWLDLREAFPATLFIHEVRCSFFADRLACQVQGQIPLQGLPGELPLFVTGRMSEQQEAFRIEHVMQR